MADLTISELTEKSLTGTGSFDVLMSAMVPHLEKEFTAGRIRGPEYSTVYLGALQQTMQTALAFLLQKRKNDLEAQLLQAQIALSGQQLLLVTEQTANAVLEGKVLVAQECKLRAEYDLTVKTIEKTAQEILLLTQKVQTEKAQTQSTGVEADSVIGKQKQLYQAQADGFKRDAEQKVAKLMSDTWSVRRTTDEGTVADGTNMLSDVAVGRAITKMLDGVGA